MKTKTVRLKKILACPQHRLDVEHWVPEHKLEECYPDLKARAEKYELRVFKNLKAKVQELSKEAELEIEKYKKNLRSKKV